MSEFGVHLRARREQLGLSLHELGARVGVSKVTAYKWEKGSIYPSAPRMPQIADALSCSIDELYGYSAHSKETDTQNREGSTL